MENTDRSQRGHRGRRIAFIAGALILVVLVSGLLWVRAQLTGSLARLEGEIVLSSLEGPVTVERDALGVPTITGSSRLDVSRALGYVHGQERFFQMDLLRRMSSGELAGLVGAAAFPADRRVRIHRFRSRAQAIAKSLPADDQRHLEAYAEGVAAGLADLDTPPFEYLILGLEPEPWRPEDTVLTVFSMYIDLQGRIAPRESSYGVLYDVQPELYELLAPYGSEWDAPIQGEAFPPPPIPGPELVNLRGGSQPQDIPQITPEEEATEEESLDKAASLEGWPWLPYDSPAWPLDVQAGSNNWAVAGTHTAHGEAMVADDMHLGLKVPNIWYRASLVYPGADGAERHVTGVTLPGAMVVIAGSTDHVAWGFTNATGDWGDLVVLESAGEGMYQTPDGPEAFTEYREVMRAKDGEEEVLEIRETRWGPVFDEDHLGRERAYRWVAHTPQAVSLGLRHMEDVKTLEEALDLARQCGTPAQNLVVATADGRIGWTILGPIPKRVGDHDGRRPHRAGEYEWDGWLTAEEAPRVVDPESGRIWTANQRVVSDEMFALLGDSGLTFGARAQQIRDALMGIERADERDLLGVQLDDRALYIQHWYDLLVSILDDAAVDGHPRRAEFRDLMDDWTGHASIDTVSYRVARAFRGDVRDLVLGSLTAPSKEADERFDFSRLVSIEGSLWHILRERPQHLLDPEFDTWDDLFLTALDSTLDYYMADGSALAEKTWGDRNTLRMTHPLSQFLPGFLAPYLDMPPAPLPGDAWMARVQRPDFGASERFVVSPSRQDQGIFHMPGGQSGHPLSPFYRAGHQDWVDGTASPFLPGEAEYVLRLVPSS